jgi:Cysteine dioxygenase type I
MSSTPTRPAEIQFVPGPLDPGPLDPGPLADIAAGLASSFLPESFRPDGFVPESGDLRRFARLQHTPAYEAWLIEWEAAADLELHDHGGSRGAFQVVAGVLAEAHSDLARPAPLETVLIRAGTGREVTTTRVHRVWNPGPARAVSVHVYSPPLSSMTFYDGRPGTFLAPLRTETVEGTPEPAGAR